VIGDRDFSAANRTVEFFGRPARLPEGPAKLALATGAPLLPTFMIRLPDDTFAYIVDEPIWADKSRQTVDDIMRQVAVALERVIRQHSEQWFLFHDLWTSNPTGRWPRPWPMARPRWRILKKFRVDRTDGA